MHLSSVLITLVLQWKKARYILKDANLKHNIKKTALHSLSGVVMSPDVQNVLPGHSGSRSKWSSHSASAAPQTPCTETNLHTITVMLYLAMPMACKQDEMPNFGCWVESVDFCNLKPSSC